MTRHCTTGCLRVAGSASVSGCPTERDISCTPCGTRRYAIAACFLIAICGVSSFADDTENDSGRTPPESSDSIPASFSGPPIFVKFSGPLELGSSMSADADSQDLSARTLTDADVIAGGTSIHLDWSRSSRIRDELLWWTIARAGDARSPYAEVTGHLRFMPLKELDQSAKVMPPGVSPDTPVPVVVVETIQFSLRSQVEGSVGLNRSAGALWRKT